MEISELPIKKHFTTSAFVTNQDRNKTLLILHPKIQRWIYAGGHLEENETPDKAVLRELKEETGLIGKVINCSDQLDLSESTEIQLATPYCVLIMKIKASSKDVEHCHIDMVYIVEVDESAPISNDEGIECRWLTLQELEESETFPSIKNIAKNVLRS